MRRALSVIILVLVATACSGGDDTSTLPETDTYLAEVSDAMHATTGAKFR